MVKYEIQQLPLGHFICDFWKQGIPVKMKIWPFKQCDWLKKKMPHCAGGKPSMAVKMCSVGLSTSCQHLEEVLGSKEAFRDTSNRSLSSYCYCTTAVHAQFTIAHFPDNSELRIQLQVYSSCSVARLMCSSAGLFEEALSDSTAQDVNQTFKDISWTPIPSESDFSQPMICCLSFFP